MHQHRTAAALLVSLLLAATPNTGCARQTSVPAWNQGAYIWDSSALLSSQQRSKELQRLQDQQMRHLLIGLSATQVRSADSSAALRDLIREAHARGQQVLLLLGDPAWINPTDRPQLMALIRRFQNVPFDGLHLDLEVEQLGWPVPAARLQDWLNTVKEAKTRSP